MTAKNIPLADAPTASLSPKAWENIDWPKVIAHVCQLQTRIAKAYRESKYRKAKALQWLLSCSFYAKLLAVKRVVSNKGSKTPGIDGERWNSPSQKIKAAASLKRRGYKTKPLKRIHIPKKQKGKFRPLSIPVMQCRAQQALHLLTLEPITEMIADKHAYGYRPHRSAADAIGQCFISLAKKESAEYVLEGDIKSCFDSISHDWLLKNTFMDKKMLRKWLKAGYIEKETLYSTLSGTPQGGIISPTLLTVTLSGLEQAIKTATNRTDKINICSYADDFIITGITKEVLEEKVKPKVEKFLNERGLSLSKEKTQITHINEGFNFLGMNIRKYNNKLIVKPCKSNVKRFLADIRDVIKRNKSQSTEVLIHLLNPKIRGWTNYYRHVCSKETFSYVDHCIFQAIWQWAMRRHPHKGKRWIQEKYFRQNKLRKWVFYVKTKDKMGNIAYTNLVEAKHVSIKRHIKIRAEATPYNPAYDEYFKQRVMKCKTGRCQTNPTSGCIGGNYNHTTRETNSQVAR